VYTLYIIAIITVNIIIIIIRRGNSGGTLTRPRARQPQTQEIPLLSETSRPALGPTRAPIQWAAGPLSLRRGGGGGLKRRCSEAENSPPSSRPTGV
jgi:hypothetical protein